MPCFELIFKDRNQQKSALTKLKTNTRENIKWKKSFKQQQVRKFSKSLGLLDEVMKGGERKEMVKRMSYAQPLRWLSIL